MAKRSKHQKKDFEDGLRSPNTRPGLIGRAKRAVMFGTGDLEEMLDDALEAFSGDEMFEDNIEHDSFEGF